MTLRIDPTRRYDMPASFGPSMVPAQTVVSRAESLLLTATVSRDGVEALVPAHFEVPETPSLTVAHMAYHDIDYLGGRSYNEVVVSVSAVQNGMAETISTSLALILWVDQPGALIAGREFMGLPKILGTISDIDDQDGELRFVCSEYDAVILSGHASELKPVDPERLERLNRRAEEVRTFGWKYIAAAGGGSDADYATLNTMRWSYDKVWTGLGDFSFSPVSFADAPMSSAALKSLSSLAIHGPVKAFRGLGQATIDREGTRRL